MPRRLIRRLNGRLLMAVLVGAVFSLMATGGYGYLSNRKASDRNETALKALCLQRDDLDDQIAETQYYLDLFPRGPIFGIPRGVIVDGQDRRKQFRRNLSILDCK